MNDRGKYEAGDGRGNYPTRAGGTLKTLLVIAAVGAGIAIFAPGTLHWLRHGSLPPAPPQPELDADGVPVHPTPVHVTEPAA